MSYRPLLLACAFWGFAHPAFAEPKSPPALPAAKKPLVLVGVAVIDVRAGKALPARTVVIKNGRIESVRPVSPDDRALLASGKAVDARGRFLLPGLWDMHAHVTHEQFRSMYLAAGVTGVRHLFSFNPWYSPRRWNTAAGRSGIPGPRVVGCDWLLDGPGTMFGFPVKLSVKSAGDEESAGAMVRLLQQGGEDFVKVHSALPRKAFAAAAREARARRIDLVGHVPLTVRVLEASEAGQRSIEHMTGVTLGCSLREEELLAQLRAAVKAGRLDPVDAPAAWRFRMRAVDSHDKRKAAALFRRLAKNRTWVTPTLLVLSSLGRIAAARDKDPRWRHLPRLVQRTWAPVRVGGGLRFPLLGQSVTARDLAGDRRLYRHEAALLLAMHRAGVELLAGTDCPAPGCLPGFGLHDELELMVEAGLTPADALRTATCNPARFFRWEADLGTVEPGKLADLVLLEGNPLEKINRVRKVAGVVVAGRLVDRPALDEILEQRKKERRK
jgi:hypothetical protein